MFYQINEKIERYLQLLFLAKNQSILFTEFRDKVDKKLDVVIGVIQIMEKKKLIQIEGDNCSLTEFGNSIIEKGGWLEYLKRIESKKFEEIRKLNPTSAKIHSKRFSFIFRRK
jgi:predicted transcriptional regulator